MHLQLSDHTLRNRSERDRILFRADPALTRDNRYTYREQAEQVMKNVQALLESQGASFTDVVKTTCFLADMADFAAFNEVYAKYFTGNPARSCVAVKALPKGVLCEVETIASVKED